MVDKFLRLIFVIKVLNLIELIELIDDTISLKCYLNNILLPLLSSLRFSIIMSIALLCFYML